MKQCKPISESEKRTKNYRDNNSSLKVLTQMDFPNINNDYKK